MGPGIIPSTVPPHPATTPSTQSHGHTVQITGCGSTIPSTLQPHHPTGTAATPCRSQAAATPFHQLHCHTVQSTTRPLAGVAPGRPLAGQLPRWPTRPLAGVAPWRPLAGRSPRWPARPLAGDAPWRPWAGGPPLPALRLAGEALGAKLCGRPMHTTQSASKICTSLVLRAPDPPPTDMHSDSMWVAQHTYYVFS